MMSALFQQTATETFAPPPVPLVMGGTVCHTDVGSIPALNRISLSLTSPTLQLSASLCSSSTQDIPSLWTILENIQELETPKVTGIEHEVGKVCVQANKLAGRS